MDLTMLIGQTNNVKFRVNVMGTSAQATARVILCTNPQLSFPAEKVGDEWMAHVAVPESVHPGDYDMKVEVMVGNRHFTPLTKRVELQGQTVPEVAAVEEAKKEDPKVEEPAVVEPLKTAALLRAITAVGAVDGSVVPATPMPIAPPAELALEPAAEEPKPEPKKKITLPKDFFKFEPKKVERVEIKMKPLESLLTHTVIDRPLAAESVKPVLELNHGTPIRLIKGEIIYE
jgi:hypothetical protein